MSVLKSPVHQPSAPSNQPLSGNPRATSAIINQTIWCATGLSGEPAEQRLPAPTVDSAKATVHNSVATESPNSPVQLEDKRLQRSTAPIPNGCADMARTEQCIVIVRWRTGLSGVPIASRNQPTTRSDWEAINTPQPPHSLPSKPSKIFIHCKSKRSTLQKQSKQLIHSKPQNQL